METIVINRPKGFNNFILKQLSHDISYIMKHVPVSVQYTPFINYLEPKEI